MVIINGVQLISANFFCSHRKAGEGGCGYPFTRQVFFLVPLILILPLVWGIEGIMFARPDSRLCRLYHYHDSHSERDGTY